jgi:hypothetical protein
MAMGALAAAMATGRDGPRVEWRVVAPPPV